MLRRLVNGLVDIVYPKICAYCGKKLTAASVDNLICSACWDDIEKNLPPFCHCCGRRLDKSSFVKNICHSCIKKKLHFDRAFSPCVYTGVIKELVHALKYKGKDYLGLSLSRLMIDFIKEYSVPMDYIDFIIPMPLHNTRLREREFNQAEILSNHIAKEFRKDLSSGILKRHRFTKTQTELETNMRLENVKGSFSIAKEIEKIKGKNILLVDDVLTTGATASEAALTLKNAGANIVFVLTLAN